MSYPTFGQFKNIASASRRAVRAREFGDIAGAEFLEEMNHKAIRMCPAHERGLAIRDLAAADERRVINAERKRDV